MIVVIQLVINSCTYNYSYYVCTVSESKSSYCNCLYHAANAMARSISRIADEEFAEADISPPKALLL